LSIAKSSMNANALEEMWPGRGTPDIDPHHGLQVLFDAYTVLVTGPDGSIDGGTRQGLFDHDTRVLSRYALRLDGVAPRVHSTSLLRANCWNGRLAVPRPRGTADGPALPQDVLELDVLRRVGNGMAERLTVHNHSMTPASTTLTVEFDADFADVGEVSGQRRQHGRVRRRWDASARNLTFHYRAGNGTHSLHRALRIAVPRADSTAVGSRYSISFALDVPPRGVWRTVLTYEVLQDEAWLTLDPDPAAKTPRDAIREEWARIRAHVISTPPAFGEIVEQAADDLSALRNWEHDAGADAWVPNAGVPTYTGLFGRDVLTAGWQAALLGPHMLKS
jgi:glycogen debranching enzyme